jgi:hypothetical protein
MAKKISLKEKLMSLALIHLYFTGITVQKSTKGEQIAILTLAEPIPNVRGSQEVEINGKRYPVSATDVKEIKVHEGDFNDDFQFDAETDTGEYRGSDLMLDVAKSGQVWLRSTSFAASGNEMRTTARNERLAKLVGVSAAPANTPANKGLVPESQD